MSSFDSILVSMLWALSAVLIVISVYLAAGILRGVAAYRQHGPGQGRKKGALRLAQAGLAIAAMYVWIRGGRETVAAINPQIALVLSATLTLAASLALLHAIYGDRGVG